MARGWPRICIQGGSGRYGCHESWADAEDPNEIERSLFASRLRRRRRGWNVGPTRLVIGVKGVGG
jgi:hypothetical protein